ncbi:NADH-cytochrome b5 reductase 1 [Tanacetum coccineum]
MSHHFRGMKEGDYLSVKGLKVRFKYRFGDVRAYGMIAGGSGITPMFQVARYILEGESDQSQTTLDLIYANVTSDDILLKVDVTLQDGRSFEGTCLKYMTDGVLLRETLKDENLDIYRFGFHRPPFNSQNHLHTVWHFHIHLGGKLGPLGGFIKARKLLGKTEALI